MHESNRWYWSPRAFAISAATSFAFVIAYWLYIFLSVQDLAPALARRLLLWAVIVVLYVPDMIVRSVGLRSYLYEAHDRMDTPGWYLSAVIVVFVGTLFYHAVWVALRAVWRSPRSPREIGHHSSS